MSRKSIKSDVARLDRLKDRDIDYSDMPPLDDAFFKKATMVAWPPAKRQVTVRLDADVLRWLKASGKGYQTRLNYILCAAMEHQGASAAARGVTKERRHETTSPRRNQALSRVWQCLRRLGAARC